MKKSMIATVLTCVALSVPGLAIPHKQVDIRKNFKTAGFKVADFKAKGKAKAKQEANSSSSSSSCSSTSTSHPSQLPTFISAAAYQSPSSSQTVLPTMPILFNEILDTKGSVVYNSLTGQFTVFDAGSYAISFGAVFTSAISEGSTPAVIALRVNGTEVAGTQLASVGDADMISMSVIQTFTGPSTNIEVIASGLNSNPINLVDPLGTTTSAFITITKLS